MGERITKVPETVEEMMTSQVFGLELTQEQIDAAKRQPKPKTKDVLFGPIARRWHREHPIQENGDDESLLLGC